MTVLSQHTWVLVADGQKALFLENLTDGEDPFLRVVSKEEQENPPDRDQSANRPGRMQDTGINQRSAVQDTDWHELAKERFADDMAEILYGLAHRNRFERLVIVAAPGVLGELRDKLHKEVASRVVGEIPKTLTNHPLDEVEKIVKEELEAA